VIFPFAEGILLLYAILTNHPETRGGILSSVCRMRVDNNTQK